MAPVAALIDPRIAWHLIDGKNIGRSLVDDIALLSQNIFTPYVLTLACQHSP